MTAWGYGRRTFLGMCAATLLATLVGCGGGGGGGGGGGATTVVTGIVFNSASGDEEVEGATVVMGGVSGTTFTVDNASANNAQVGSFRLENVPEGTAIATVTFLNRRQIGETDQSETFTDTQTVAFFPPIARGSNTGIELFVNIAQVSGRILLPDGTPAANANVFLAPSGLTATTDTEGKYFIPNVPAEPIEVTAVRVTASATKTVTVVNGNNELGDLQLVDDPNPNPPGLKPTVTGSVTLEGGTGAGGSNLGSGATVILLRNGAQIEQTIASAEGKFSFYVPTGNYSVRVFLDGFIDASKDFSITNPNQPPDVPVVLQRR